MSPYHPDLARLAKVLPRAPFTRRTVRLMQRLSAIPARRTPPGVSVHGLAHGVTVRVHGDTDPASPSPAMLWIHGGGYVIGSAAQDDRLCAAFARALKIPVAAVDYRLAPKHPYPAAVDDCDRAYNWLTEQLFVDASRVVVAGASAGGGLAAALCLRLRDNGIRPLFQHLVYPMIDDTAADTPTDVSRFARLWSARSNRLGWDLYLGDADPAVAVPARHPNLAGLPRTWIGVGTLDLFHPENDAYAQRLRDAGVPCTVDVVEGAFHGFDQIAPKAGVSQHFFERQCTVLGDAIRAS